MPSPPLKSTWSTLLVRTLAGPDWLLTAIVAARARLLSDRIPAGPPAAEVTHYSDTFTLTVAIFSNHLLALGRCRSPGPTQGRHSRLRASFRANYSHLRRPFGSLPLLSASPPMAPPFLTLPAVHRATVTEIYSDAPPALGLNRVGWSAWR